MYSEQIQIKVSSKLVSREINREGEKQMNKQKTKATKKMPTTTKNNPNSNILVISCVFSPPIANKILTLLRLLC